jgi:hypothetical protein
MRHLIIIIVIVIIIIIIIIIIARIPVARLLHVSLFRGRCLAKALYATILSFLAVQWYNNC